MSELEAQQGEIKSHFYHSFNFFYGSEIVEVVVVVVVFVVVEDQHLKTFEGLYLLRKKLLFKTYILFLSRREM